MIFNRQSEFSKIYKKNIEKIFRETLKRDVKNRNKHKGYPSYWTMKFSELSKKTGKKFTDPLKGDYTLAPLINQFSYLVGGKKSFIYKLLNKFNMKIFGGFMDTTRLQAQINFFTSYNEYAKDFQPISILENILRKEIPLYMRKIVEDFKFKADRHGTSLKGFVLDNREYFKEVVIYFEFKDKTDIQALKDAVEDLTARKSAKGRDYLMKANMANAVFNIVAMIITFGKLLIPNITENFDARIEDFSKTIQVVDRLSTFLTSQWYLALVVAIIIYFILKSRLVRLVWGYFVFKIPVIGEYVVNDQLSRFLKSYYNMMKSGSARNAFIESVKMVQNEYLRFVLSTFTDGGNNDMGDTGITFYKILENIPYIPKEYVDIITESEITGKPEEGIKKVIQVIEPKMERLVKEVNKQIFWIVNGVSVAISVLLFIKLYQDMNVLINTYNQEFIDRLKN